MGGPPLRLAHAADRPAQLPSGNLGRLALGFLAVCAASGFALAPFYSPPAALDSLEKLTGSVPWGSLVRAVHTWSGFGLLVAALAHLAEVSRARTERQLSKTLWWASVLLLPILGAALLGGFTMRGDAEAGSALLVWRGILDSVPAVGRELSRLALGAGDERSGAVALHHAGTFTVLLWVLTAAHGKRVLPDRRSFVLAALISVAFAGIFRPGLGSIPSSPASPPRLLLGPWYLLGLQGALMHLPAAVGWVGPLLFLLVIGLLREADGAARRALIVVAGVWVAAYLFFTARLVLVAS